MNTILEAATQVFEKRGYLGATTNHIAERAGVSVGSVYQYFPNKESILNRLMERHIDDAKPLIEDILVKHSDQRPLEKITIKKIVAMLVQIHRGQQAYHRIILEEVPAVQRALTGPALQAETSAAKLLEDALNHTPNCRKKNIPKAAITFMQTVNWLIHRHMLYSEDNKEDGNFIEETTDILARYVLS